MKLKHRHWRSNWGLTMAQQPSSAVFLVQTSVDVVQDLERPGVTYVWSSVVSAVVVVAAVAFVAVASAAAAAVEWLVVFVSVWHGRAMMQPVEPRRWLEQG